MEHLDKQPMDLSGKMPPTSMSSGTLWSQPMGHQSASSIPSSIDFPPVVGEFEMVDPYMVS